MEDNKNKKNDEIEKGEKRENHYLDMDKLKNKYEVKNSFINKDSDIKKDINDKLFIQDKVENINIEAKEEGKKIEKQITNIKELKKLIDNNEEIIEIDYILKSNRKEYPVKVSTLNKENIEKRFGGSLFGMARWHTNDNGNRIGGEVFVKSDLFKIVKNFVLAHELYHIQDEKEWLGVFGKELRANLIPGMKNPIGLLVTIWKTITSKERLSLYLDRIKNKY